MRSLLLPVGRRDSTTPASRPWLGRTGCGIVALIALSLGGRSASAAEPPAPAAPLAAEIQRDEHELLGWRVLIDRRLNSDQESLSQALELLERQLAEIVERVPEAAVGELRKVPLYFSPEYPNVAPKAEYHPDPGWLVKHGREPAMARAVEFTNVRIFAAETDRMPNFVLHELAHAYHHRFLPEGFGNPEIRAAYERARAAGIYERVERWFGNGRPNRFEVAYAMSSPMEYFAETTEAFFSRNDFYPFTRAELREHDPAMHALLAELWGASSDDANPILQP